jgi:hypothetical protein
MMNVVIMSGGGVMHVDEGVAQSLRRVSVGDVDAPEADAEPREADAGPERLTQTLEADDRRFHGADWS